MKKLVLGQIALIETTTEEYDVHVTELLKDLND